VRESRPPILAPSTPTRTCRRWTPTHYEQDEDDREDDRAEDVGPAQGGGQATGAGEEAGERWGESSRRSGRGAWNDRSRSRASSTRIIAPTATDPEARVRARAETDE